jgi:hypothetical protein
LASAAYWLQTIAVGPGDNVAPFLVAHEGEVVAAWRHLARRAFRTGEIEEYRSNQGERLIGQALNQPSGTLAFIGIALADRAFREPAQFPLLAGAREEIDETLAGTGPGSRPLVAARIAEWLGLSAQILPRSTEILVTGPLERDPPELSLLDLHMLYGRGMSETQYQRLEPILLREARLGRLSQKGNEHNVGRLVWRALDKSAGKREHAPASSDLRSILQRSTTDVRSSVARVCRNWFGGIEEADKERLWRDAGKPFFRDIWPLDAALRHPSVSEELLRLPAATGPAFDDAAAHLITLTVPFHLYDVATLFVGLQKRPDYESLREAAKAFSAQHWGAVLDMLDAALGPSPTVRPHNLSDWLDNLCSLVPETNNDLRLKRLYRLTQR